MMRSTAFHIPAFSSNHQAAMKKTHFLVLFLAFLLTACGYQPPTPPVDRKTPVSTPAPAVDPSARVQADLAARLGLPPDQLALRSIESVDWPDGCLGVYQKDVLCTEAIVPGYRVIFEAGEQRYEFHTDQNGDFYKELPVQASIGPALLTWRSNGLPCRLAQFNADGAALGACNGGLLVTALPRPRAADELNWLAANYAFAAGETPAGSVRFQGSGTRTAGPAEIRAIAEWAASLSQELSGTPPANEGLMLVWKRNGGIAGFCDELFIYRSGFARAQTCASQTAADPAAQLHLAEDELQQLYGWAEHYQTASFTQSDGAVADSMSQSLEFYGQGSQPLTANEQPAFLNFAADRYARLTAK